MSNSISRVVNIGIMPMIVALIILVASTGVTFAAGPELGSLTVCKVLADATGAPVEGVSGSTFSITLTGGEASMVASFETPLALNAKILNDEVNDGQCKTFADLAIGDWKYSQETTTSSHAFEAPKYSDQATHPVNTVSDLFLYGQSGDEYNADGDIVLLTDRKDRTIIIYNKLQAVETVTHTLTYTAGANGSLTGTSTQSVVDGADGTAVTPVPNSGFHFVDWSDDSTANPRTDTHVTGDVTVTANFAADESSSGGGGSGGGTPTPPTGGGNGPIVGLLSSGGGGGGGGSSQGHTAPLPGTGGQVLGASTSTVSTAPISCSALLTSYMRMGKANDAAQVTRLQQFLKDHGYNALVTGFFGTVTDAAVRKFQLDHTADVLTPWGITDPTGYVYKTTLYTINKIACPTLGAPVPVI